MHDLTAMHNPEMCTPDVLEWTVLLRRALRRGAWSVCVGTAITHPATITSWFVAAVDGASRGGTSSGASVVDGSVGVEAETVRD